MDRFLKAIIFILCIVAIPNAYASTTQSLDDKNDPKYAIMWKKVDSLEQKGLYNMALTQVNQIFDYASTNKHHNQVIKSVLYELKFNSYLKEDDYVLGIARLETLIDDAPSPSKEILHSLLAEVYWGYYSGNSWKFNERTNVVDVDLNDVRTWDLKRIAVKIRWHYGKSLQNESHSQGKKISEFEEIISPGNEDGTIRPTLYDFLGHRALDFFKSTTFSLPGPAETFVIEEPAFFYSNSSFLKMNAATKDSLNTRFLAARVFYALTDFHARRNDQKALFYLELERLAFANTQSTLTNKDELYYAALERMANAYKANDYASEAWYEMAVYHSTKGQNYHHLRDTTTRWERKVAYDICQKTIEKYPGSYGSEKCKSLQSNLLQKELKLSAENTLVPNLESKFLLQYRNINKAHIKIVPLDYDKINTERYRGDKLYKFLKKEKGIYQETAQLIDPNDYNQHSIELLLPKLKAGFYFLVVSSDGSFDKEKSGFTHVPLQVTNITYQSRRTGKWNEVMVSKRDSGKPIEGASVQVHYEKYNYALQRYEKKNVGTFKTDAFGKIKFAPREDYTNYYFTIKTGDEKYEPNSSIYGYRYNENEENRIVTHFFTDRKIYRPGQKIFFKGIVVHNKGKERKLKTNAQATVHFYDVNNQLIESKTLKVNQFGSFEGEFTAPFGVLTGLMRITDGRSSTSFRVEEYKRPKFNVEMKPVEGEFQVNDSILATGVATAYAGNKIDGAAVNYRVVRSTQYNWGYWWGWRPYAEPKEIANGSLKTDENGEFTVIFKAHPDKESDPKSLPIFTYTIYADVTDINGETHSTSTNVQVGYQSLQLGNNLAAEMNNAQDFLLQVSTTNLNGQTISASGTIKVEKLKMSEQPFYSRLWERPDMQNWTKTEFKKRFPNEAYKNEDNRNNWAVEKSVFETNFDTKNTDSIAIANYKDWAPGAYRYTATALDKNGVEVQDIYLFNVFNPAATTAPTNEVLWIKPLKTRAEPGEQVTFLLATLESDLIITYDTEANGKLIESKQLKLSKEQHKITFNIKEAYRGNFTVHFTAIKNNRNFSNAFTIIVPYTHKELDLSFSSFRNKLLPGADEEWTLTVKNRKGDKEQAELLATLYDASLDELYTPNSFYMNVYKTYYGNKGWSSPDGLGLKMASNVNYYWNSSYGSPYRYFPTLKYFGWSAYYYGGYNRGYFGEFEVAAEMMMDDSDSMVLETAKSAPGKRNKDAEKKESGGLAIGNSLDKSLEGGEANNEEQSELDNRRGESNDGKKGLNEVKARSNFNETAFFYPQLTANAKGDVQIKFTIPESLTKWRFLGLAHTKDLKVGTISEEVVTQKELMVVPNAPRFLREGDQITISAKISNISKEDLKGQAQLSLYDPFTENPIDDVFNLSEATTTFTADQGKSTVVSWTIDVPYTQSAVKYKIVAQAADFSDGEENVLPILSNRMMVTESLPLPIRGKEKKLFTFDKLLNSGKSKTLKHHRYTLEFTSNPAWYAVQAMPYMMEYPHECAEQTFTRYYSNVIATHIMNSNPKIKQVVEDWGQNSPEAFLSNLQKNQELKAVILEETPWVLDAKNEEASKRNLAVLLDMERMSRELDKALGKIMKMQVSNGAWPWFPGMPESRYITQHIVTGMGHLDHLCIKDIREDNRVWRMVTKAISYLDKEIVKDFERAKKWDKDYLKNQHISYTQIQYLYARSYFPSVSMNKNAKEAVAYYKDQAAKYWLNFNIYAEGMIGLAAHRFANLNKGEPAMATLASDIVKSLKDRSIQHEEFGMYWKDYTIGYYWYQAPIETQAVMIELFDEVANDQESVEELKIWLLKQKQTTNWKTTKQTTEAVYALLLKGTDLLASDEMVEITLGGQRIEYSDNPDQNNPYQVKAEAGTGYFKTAWKAGAVKPEMGKITVAKSDAGVAWGAAYWQYFEDLDKITFAETNLKLKKDLFLVTVSDQGEQLASITDENVLKVGQKVRVRVELRTDRNLEYVHMKDMRASGFEPINVLSRYRYREGLGYYESTKDAATHFFFDYIPKGTYVFEYDLRVQHKGDFSNGITTIQCMYAPEFTSHSDGIRVKVE